MSPHQYEGRGILFFCRFCQVDNFRNIGQIVTRKGDDIRLPLVDHSKIIFRRFGLQIKEPHFVAGSTPADPAQPSALT